MVEAPGTVCYSLEKWKMYSSRVPPPPPKKKILIIEVFLFVCDFFLFIIIWSFLFKLAMRTSIIASSSDSSWRLTSHCFKFHSLPHPFSAHILPSLCKNRAVATAIDTCSPFHFLHMLQVEQQQSCTTLDSKRGTTTCLDVMKHWLGFFMPSLLSYLNGCWAKPTVVAAWITLYQSASVLTRGRSQSKRNSVHERAGGWQCSGVRIDIVTYTYK